MKKRNRFKIRKRGILSFVILTSVTHLNAQTSFKAVSDQGLSTEFENAVIADGKSIVTVEKEGITMVAVAGTTPANNDDGDGQQIQPDGTVIKWNDVSWSPKNQGDIDFYYIQGTGNPYTKLEAEEITADGVPQGIYRAKYTYYLPDGSNGMPVSGLYYKFTATASGKLKVGVWSNKGNRNTFVVDESTMLPANYEAEGYINGQNETVDAGGGTMVTKKKYLTNEEIKALHDAAFIDETTGEDKSPYVIGAGNQPFWGYITIQAEAGKTYWFFQDSSQLGFQGFEFGDGDPENPQEPDEETNQAVPDWIMNMDTGNNNENLYVRNITKITFTEECTTTTGEEEYLILTDKDGSVTDFALKGISEITLSDTEIIITTTDKTIAMDFSKVANIGFGNTASSIESVTTEHTIIKNSEAYVNGIKPGDTVSLYTTDGMLMHTVKAKENKVHIDLSSLKKKRVYILSTPSKSYKIAIR